jgi:hypothetical protein
MPDPSMSPGWRNRLKSSEELRAGVGVDADPAHRADVDELKVQHFELLQEWLRTKRPTRVTDAEREVLLEELGTTEASAGTDSPPRPEPATRSRRPRARRAP